MEYKSIQMKESSVNTKDRVFEGYASTFDEDLVGDIIHAGAFKKSILEAFPANRIKVLWQHFDPLGMPTEMHEDTNGLYVKAKVSRTRLGDEALELMSDGVVDRMSIGFTIPREKSFYDDEGKRHITEVKLMEFSPVTFPANESAVITGVKALNEQIIVAKTMGLVNEKSADYEKLITEINALLKACEPSNHTRVSNIEPLVTECKGILTDLSDFAKQIA